MLFISRRNGLDSTNGKNIPYCTSSYLWFIQTQGTFADEDKTSKNSQRRHR